MRNGLRASTPGFSLNVAPARSLVRAAWTRMQWRVEQNTAPNSVPYYWVSGALSSRPHYTSPPTRLSLQGCLEHRTIASHKVISPLPLQTSVLSSSLVAIWVALIGVVDCPMKTLLFLVYMGVSERKYCFVFCLNLEGSPCLSLEASLKQLPFCVPVQLKIATEVVATCALWSYRLLLFFVFYLVFPHLKYRSPKSSLHIRRQQHSLCTQSVHACINFKSLQ